MSSEERFDGLVGVVIVRLAILAGEKFEGALLDLVSGFFEAFFPLGGLVFLGRDDFALFVHQESAARETTWSFVRGLMPDLGAGTDELGVLGSLDMV